MMRVELLAFDLDGTLVDSRLDIAEATNHALRATGRSPLSVEEIAGYVGDGARPLLSRAARVGETAPELEPLLAVFLEYYTAHATTHTSLMPHAREVLEELGREHALVLVTNKPRQTTDAVLRELDLARYFRGVSAGGDLPQKKPDPEPLLVLTRALGVAPAEVVVVGDGPQDIECGRAAGARTVGVRSGILPEARLLASRPDWVIDDLGELPALVRSLEVRGSGDEQVVGG